VSDGWIRATGAAFAVYGIVMLLRRERFAEWAARSHVRTARILPIFYPGRSKELESQLRLWRVGIILLALSFVALGLLLLANPAWLNG
jgi:hypothetical protein